MGNVQPGATRDRHCSHSFYCCTEIPTGSNGKRQDPPIKRDLFVSLEDISRGFTKKIRISRIILQADGSERKEAKMLYINVKPGSTEGTEIIFPREGDERVNTIPADVVFTIRDKPHQFFKREGSDIRYTAKISLRDALCGAIINVPTLSEYMIILDLRNVIVTPDFEKKLKGEGLPFYKQPRRKGSLLISVDITFPDSQPNSVKEILYEALPD